MLGKIFGRLKIDNAQINLVHKAGLTTRKSLSLGKEKSVHCPY